MSISSALNSAITGLRASGRAADVTSANLANVLTEGYAPRQLELETLGYGQPGVLITGISRRVDPSLIADRRTADGALAYAETRADFLNSLQYTLGTPDNPASLPGRLAAFEAALLTAANTPESPVALRSVVTRADELVQSFNSISNEIERQRTQADGRISTTVTRVNTLLSNIQALNTDIARTAEKDHLAASLLDQRQQQIDELTTLIPVRQVPRDNGTVALFTPGGAILLDGNAAVLEFTVSNVVAPHMTLDNGFLSGLSINGYDVAPSGPNSPIAGGQLAALFSIRDELGVQANTQIDALTRNMLERVQQTSLDPTLALGDPGIFTDGGLLFDPTNEVGVAGRISVNALVDPSQGGEVWRLRDGLGALAEGPPGNNTLLTGLTQALTSNLNLASGDLGGAARGLSGHIATYSSQLGNDRLTLDQSLSFASVRQNELLALEREEGVDSDAELQNLLLIEQAYAANARMIQTVDEMMQAILRI